MDNTKKNPNVPNLRFSTDQSKWKTSKIGYQFNLSSGSTPSTKDSSYFNNGDTPWINSGELSQKYISVTEHVITKKAIEDYHLKIYPRNTLVIAIYGLEAEGVRGKASITNKDATISQSCMAFEPIGNISNQFMYYFYKKHANTLGIRYAQGTKQQNLSSDLLSSYSIYYPEIDEQKKITDFLSLIDERIATQNKIINNLESQIKQIKKDIIKTNENYTSTTLDNVCTIATGKRDANEMIKNGKYKFFTCSKEDFYIDTYSFDGEALIISGNGELGMIKHYCGKFDAYQRTYVLQNFKCNPKYLMSCLEIELPKKIAKEKNVGAMPYIVLGTLTSIKLKIPCTNVQNEVVKILDALTNKIINEKQILTLLNKQKQYLLNNLFI